MTKKSVEDKWMGFLKLCSNLHSPKEFKVFFDLFLTHEEKEQIASRYLIVKELLEDQLTQREIADKHTVSIAQITRGSNALKIVDPKIKDFLNEQLGITT